VGYIDEVCGQEEGPKGESMKKKPITPRLKSFPRTTFSTW